MTLTRHIVSMHLQRVVQLEHLGQRFTFQVEARAWLGFWFVESAGRIYHAPLRATGNEQANFFRSLATVAARQWS
jgi:hypothetical protein